eukprot:gnl/TRDRNA2_/TRDRNA2_40902_c0_seq1.p1 gnl/TRDRNA2_/TRDRNA2_40902_c0~~gnl/TRDRNA2_/TRDRNA2_40902_c0_seq1.p1  ORF type:complete len:409 (-),score=56.16 gnl/TRDRNA2_/TRDRNA2_40902_c0_seq1:117-1295(-)
MAGYGGASSSSAQPLPEAPQLESQDRDGASTFRNCDNVTVQSSSYLGEDAVIFARDTHFRPERPSDISDWDPHESNDSRTTLSGPKHKAKDVGHPSGEELEMPDHATFAEALQEHGISEVQELIGHGSFSTVYRCASVVWDQPVVLKVIKGKRPLKQDSEAQLLLGVADHPNFVRLMSVIEVPIAAIILEYCAGGTLYDVLHKENRERQRVAEDLNQRLRAMLDVANAVAYLHKEGIVHRDVKSSNCFLTAPVPIEPAPFSMPTVKLGDLNLSRFTDGGGAMTKMVGTIVYMAPEVMMGAEGYGCPADVYSCGILMHELATMEVPYSGSDTFSKQTARLTVDIFNGRRPSVDILPAGCDNLRNLVSECWHPDPSERPTASDMWTRLRCMVAD